MTESKNYRRLASFLRRYPKLLLIPYYVYRFFQPKYSIGVVGLLFNANREILLVEHVFHPKLPWGLPGGWIGRNEDPALAIQREFEEELSLQIDINYVTLVRRTQYHHLDIAFVCSSTEQPIGDLSYELLQYQWCAIDQLPPLHRFHYDAIQEAYTQETNRSQYIRDH